jgi:hypothetical protein
MRVTAAFILFLTRISAYGSTFDFQYLGPRGATGTPMKLGVSILPTIAQWCPSGDGQGLLGHTNHVIGSVLPMTLSAGLRVIGRTDPFFFLTKFCFLLARRMTENYRHRHNINVRKSP